MNIKSSKRIICIVVLTVILLSSIGLSYAATTQDLNDINAQIAEKHSEIAGVKEKMTDTLSQINKLNTQISGFEDDISMLQTNLDGVNAQITEKTANLEEQETKYTEQKDLLEKRLVALYENGTTTYLDMLLSSEDITDFISNYYLIEQMAEADEELLTKIETTKNQIAAEKEYLESAKNELETTQKSIQDKKNSMASSVNQKQNLVNNLSEEEKILQAELEEFERDKRAIQAELAKLSSSYNGVVVEPSAAGYGTPIPGKTKRNITTGYYGYSGHTGVDFACSAGTPITAVKAGTVVTSTALKRPNGKYKSYGEYIVIDHHDGTMTLYAHMLPGTRAVQKGQSVYQGQTIGQVGSTGNSTGNHLHFEVRIGGKPVNPTPYLP